MRIQLLVLLAATILGYQLLVPPPIGLANNGDFARVTGWFRMAAPASDENAFTSLKYHFRLKYPYRDYYSSEVLLTAIAVAAGRLFCGNAAFDLRWLGCIHAVLVLSAMYLLSPLLRELSMARRIALSALILLVSTDVMYASYLNSFYMDAAAYVFLLLSAVLFLRAARWRRKADAVCLVICSALLVAAKPQHAVLGFWIAVLFALWGAGLWPKRSRMFAAVSSAVMVAASVAELKAGAPSGYAAKGVYTVIFYQVLPLSKNPADDLPALGLDASYRQWVGTHAFSQGARLEDPAFVSEFMRRTSYARLAWYFLRHPRSACIALDTSLAEGGRQRPVLGNYDRNAGRAPFAESRTFAIWSDLKRWAFHGHGTRYLILYAALAISVCTLAAFQRRSISAATAGGVCVLAAMGLTAMLVASLADAVDVPRHHFLSNALFDLLLLAAVSLMMAGAGPGRTSVAAIGAGPGTCGA